MNFWCTQPSPLGDAWQCRNHFGCICSMQKFRGQGSNLRHSSDHARSLTARPLGNSCTFLLSGLVGLCNQPLVGRVQGCCSPSSRAQDGLQPRTVNQPRTVTVVRLRNLTGKPNTLVLTIGRCLPPLPRTWSQPWYKKLHPCVSVLGVCGWTDGCPSGSESQPQQ